MPNKDFERLLDELFREVAEEEPFEKYWAEQEDIVILNKSFYGAKPADRDTALFKVLDHLRKALVNQQLASVKKILCKMKERNLI